MHNRPPLQPGLAIASLCLGAAALLAWLGPTPAHPCDARPVLAYGLPTPTIEDVFAATGMVRLDGRDYRLSDGIFRSQHGVRAWVAVQAHPPGTYGAPQQATRPMLLERDGQIFCGTLRARTAQHASPVPSLNP